MFKLAAAVIDFYDDPEFSKEAELFNGSLVPPDRAFTLQDADFAVKIATAAGEHRKFPVYNRTATALSGRYFDKIASTLPEPIKKVAGYHLRAAHQKFGLDLPASLMGFYEIPGSRTVSYTPDADLGGAESGEDILKIAEEFFVDQSRSMNVLEKVAKAADITRASEIAGRDVEAQEIRDYTPKDFYGPHLHDGLAQREILVRSDGILKEAYAQILTEFATMSPREGPFLLFHFDKIAGFDHRYKDGIMDPFYAAWGGVPVVEKQADAAELLNYKLGTIARTDLLKQVLGEAAHAEFVRHPIGAYERWSKEKPDWKAVVDSLLKNIPSDKAPDAEAPELKKAVSKMKKEKKPSERPALGLDVGEAGAQARIDAGL